MKVKKIAIVGARGWSADLLEKTLRAADTEVFMFAGQTGLFRSARSRRFDLAVVRIPDVGARAMSTVAKIRGREAADKVVVVFAEDLAGGAGVSAELGCDGEVFEPLTYGDLITAVATLIAPNELLEEQHASAAAAF